MHKTCWWCEYRTYFRTDDEQEPMACSLCGTRFAVEPNLYAYLLQTNRMFDERRIEVEHVGQINFDDYGGHRTDYYIVRKAKDFREAVYAMKRAGHPVAGTHCCHEYDCCGHYYAHPLEEAPEILFGDGIPVKIAWFQNV